MLIPGASLLQSKLFLNSNRESRNQLTPRKDVTTGSSYQGHHPYLNNQEETYQKKKINIMNLSTRSLSVPKNQSQSQNDMKEKIVPPNELYTKLKLNLLTS